MRNIRNIITLYIKLSDSINNLWIFTFIIIICNVVTAMTNFTDSFTLLLLSTYHVIIFQFLKLSSPNFCLEIEVTLITLSNQISFLFLHIFFMLFAVVDIAYTMKCHIIDWNCSNDSLTIQMLNSEYSGRTWLLLHHQDISRHGIDYAV